MRQRRTGEPRRPRGRGGRGRLLPLGVLALLGCSPADDAAVSELRVHAAASLSDAFLELEAEFEARHPAVDVTLSFAGSQVLRYQIEQGAPGDVVALADPTHMDALVGSGLVGVPRLFARNELVLIVPAGSGEALGGLGDLTRAERLVIGTEQVPAGRYARELLARWDAQAGERFSKAVLDRVVSEESNVRLVRAKVELGEADAALVYRSDAVASDRVRSIPLPADVNVGVEYPIAVLEGTRSPGSADTFVAYVLSPAGQAVLSRWGFDPVDSPKEPTS